MNHARMTTATGNIDHEAAGLALYARRVEEADAWIAGGPAVPRRTVEEIAVIVDRVASHVLDDETFCQLVDALVE